MVRVAAARGLVRLRGGPVVRLVRWPGSAVRRGDDDRRPVRVQAVGAARAWTVHACDVEAVLCARDGHRPGGCVAPIPWDRRDLLAARLCPDCAAELAGDATDWDHAGADPRG